MAHPGLICVFIGVTVATFLYFMFGTEEQNEYTYQRDRNRYRESNDFYENYNSSFYDRNIPGSRDFDDCSICLTSLRSGKKVVLKACHHAFHKHCIDEWKQISNKKSCPNCRRHIE